MGALPYITFLRRLLVCAFCVWLCAFVGTNPALAQRPEWQEGTVVFTNGDTLSGNLFLNQEADLLQVEMQGSIKAYTPYQVMLAAFLDPPKLYASHLAALRGNLEVPTFFEVLYPGPFATLLCRERASASNPNVVDQYGQPIGTFFGTEPKQEFYVLNAKGKVRKCPTKRAELARFIEAPPAEALTDYVKTNKPSPTSASDLVALVAFYNHLKAGQPGVLR